MPEQVVAAVNPDGSLIGSGGGTSNVSVTNFPANQTVSGTVTITNTSAAPNYTVAVVDPSITGIYTFCLPDAPGVVAANNFVSLFNPVGSGKTVVVFSATVSSYVAGGGNTSKNSLLGTRITAASVGTLQAASTISKARTSTANPVAEVRTGNPTVTAGANIVAFPPPIGTDTASTSERIVATTGAAVTLAAGEGIVFRTLGGDTDENFNIAFTWGEI